LNQTRKHFIVHRKLLAQCHIPCGELAILFPQQKAGREARFAPAGIVFQFAPFPHNTG
jgi:hypothetical protein